MDSRYLFSLTPELNRTIWVDNVFNNELDITIIGKENIARVKISRLIKDNFVEKIGEFPENGSSKAVYQKTGLIMR